MARLDSAHEHVTTGMRIAREAKNPYLETLGLLVTGLTSRDLGRLHEAAEQLELAISRSKWISWWDDGLALQNLGWVYWELGRLADGLDILAPKVTAGTDGNRNARAAVLDAVAKINITLGRHDEALEQAMRAFAKAQDKGRRWIQASILNTVAAAHRELAHFDRAMRLGSQALALARESRYARPEADGLLGLSLTLKAMGRNDEARAHAEQALALARARSFRVVEGQALTALCDIAASEEAHATAVELGREALTIHRETGHRPGEARTLLALARAHRRTDGTAAELMRQQAWDIFSDIGVPTKEEEDLDQ